eukprot:5569440-Amphidinium_carterae.1
MALSPSNFDVKIRLTMTRHASCKCIHRVVHGGVSKRKIRLRYLCNEKSVKMRSSPSLTHQAGGLSWLPT